MLEDDDDEDVLGGLFENGHWEWNNDAGSLVYVSDLPPKELKPLIKSMKITGAIQFRDDIDLIEQVRYRRRYQRKVKPGEQEIITLQDVKDLALYTAPTNILSTMLINILHTATMERFLRALILCVAYYLQLTEAMAFRAIELETKLRTPDCDIIENEYRQNLSDLRMMVGKEYATILVGGNDMKKFHHMGVAKKQRSLSDKDARFFEILLRMFVQIVWIALGRRNFNQIELEIHRIFKSEIFNGVEHTLKTGYITKMSPCERNVLLGACVRHDKKVKICSPIMNEVFCERVIDFRLPGLGVIQYNKLSTRLQYLWLAIAANEEELMGTGVSLGIIGMPRGRFDTMLRPLPSISGKSNKSGFGKSSVFSKSVASGRKKGTQGGPGSPSKQSCSSSAKKNETQLYPDIVLPHKSATETFMPSMFPDTPETPRPISEQQRRRWLQRYLKLTKPLMSK